MIQTSCTKFSDLALSNSLKLLGAERDRQSNFQRVACLINNGTFKS